MTLATHTCLPLQAFSSCLCLADIRADGEYRLLIADANKTLKVYKGTSLQAEYPLMDQPSALATFYTDLDSPQKPSVAVAAGSHVYIYRTFVHMNYFRRRMYEYVGGGARVGASALYRPVRLISAFHASCCSWTVFIFHIRALSVTCQ